MVGKVALPFQFWRLGWLFPRQKEAFGCCARGKFYLVRLEHVTLVRSPTSGGLTQLGFAGTGIRAPNWHGHELEVISHLINSQMVITAFPISRVKTP